MTDKELKEFINFQQEESDAVEIYKRLGNRAKSNTNRDFLLEMSKE